jgi:hypothetical protein
MQTTLSELRQNNPLFFDRKTCRMFGDRSHRVLLARESRDSYLVQETTGMPELTKVTFKIRPIYDNYHIGAPIAEFDSYYQVKNWMKNN